MKRVTYSSPRSVWTGGTTPQTWYGFHDSALVVSHNNPNVDGVYVSGGPFYVKHRSYSFDAVDLDWTLNGVRRRYSPVMGVFSSTVPVAPASSQLISESNSASISGAGFGATGWKRTRPGNPVAGVSTFIGESRDFLPSLPGKLYRALESLIKRKQKARRLEGFKGLSDAYLNVQFGWLPLLSDIQKMYELSKTLDKRLAQIERDNGKGVRRSTIIRDSTSKTPTVQESSSPFTYWSANVPPSWTGGYSRVVKTVTTSDKIWYVGKYRYYIPDVGTTQWTNRARRALYGANVTPEVIYNLLPWSWLVDWFTNVGDVVSNASSNAVDNLTADYAYVMRTVETQTDYEGFCRWNEAGAIGTSTWIPGGSASKVGHDLTITKSRVAASPFGFGVTFDGLSSYQMGIAAAIGISRW